MKKTVLVLCLGGLALAGCGESGKESADDKPVETTYSVDELVKDSTLFNTVFEKCQGNPGELRKTPNCVNAYAALHKKQAGGKYLPPSP